jgi:hypothetical protein
LAAFFDRIPGSDLDGTVDCSEICQRLLYNGGARRVIVGKALSGGDAGAAEAAGDGRGSRLRLRRAGMPGA